MRVITSSSATTTVICSNVPEDSHVTTSGRRTPLWTVLQRATTSKDRRQGYSRKGASFSMTVEDDDSLTVNSCTSDAEDGEQEYFKKSPSSLSHHPIRSCLSTSSTTGEEKINKSVQLKRHAQVKYTLHLNQYTQEEISSTWYTPKELHSIKGDYTKEKKLQELLLRVSAF